VITPFDDELNLGMELVGVGAPLQQWKKKKRRRKEY
jgi:hypothetical protein